MFDVMELDDAEYRLKPMNCPFHILIYKDSLKSYRDLPVRLGELGTVYRYERSGVMHGLLRVRGFTQDDAHIFCTPEQIENEIADCVEFARDVLKDFGFDKFQTELSTWDPADRRNFVGSDEQWNVATHSLEKVLKRAEHRIQDHPWTKPRSTARRSTSSWWTPSAACGSSRPSSSISTCRSASGWSTSPKTARASSR